MTEARTAGVYADDSQLPQPTGSDAQRTIASIHARLVARYRLSAVPGRPEELADQNDRRVSLAYASRSIRIRKQQGRTWLDHIDLVINEGWHAEVYRFLDGHFGFVSPATLGPVARDLLVTPNPTMDRSRAVTPSPINDDFR